MTRVTTATQAAAAAEAEGADLNLVSKSEFARLNGWSKSYISKLGSEGRLVVTEDGKQVLVAESLARIRETTTAPERASDAVVSTQYRGDRDRREFYDAENARLDLEERLGKLLQASEVTAAVAQAGTLLRQRLEGWPHRLAPQMAALAGNEGRIRGLLIDEAQLLLADISAGLGEAAAAAQKAPRGDGPRAEG